MNVQIAGKAINLVMDTAVYDQMCERGYFVEEIDDKFAGRDRVKTLCDLVAIMGTRGTGETITADWVKENLKFSEHPTAKAAIINTILDAMHSETEEEQTKDEAVDLVLEEIEKKKEVTA